MKLSVWIWVGMAGEVDFSTVLSWTSRSKIAEPAGDATRGDAESPRVGDVGTAKRCSFWLGDVVDCAVEDAVDASLGMVGGLDDASDADESSFFLPRPKNPRFLGLTSFFFSSLAGLMFSMLLAGCGVEQSRLVFSKAAVPGSSCEEERE